LAVCWLIVDPPRMRPPDALRFIASSIAVKLKPWCEQKVLSSAAIEARTMSRSIWSIGIQSRVAPRPATISPIIVKVIGGLMNR
jgi:hypothetical protein